MVSGRSVAAFTPGRGWRLLPRLPEAGPGSSVVWDGSELPGRRRRHRAGARLCLLAYERHVARACVSRSGRKGAAAVWTGTRLLPVGAASTASAGRFRVPPHGLAYDPRANSWAPLPQAPLRGRLSPVGAWTGRSLLVWGGDPGFADGAAFTPSPR